MLLYETCFCSLFSTFKLFFQKTFVSSLNRAVNNIHCDCFQNLSYIINNIINQSWLWDQLRTDRNAQEIFPLQVTIVVTIMVLSHYHLFHDPHLRNYWTPHLTKSFWCHIYLCSEYQYFKSLKDLPVIFHTRVASSVNCTSPFLVGAAAVWSTLLNFSFFLGEFDLKHKSFVFTIFTIVLGLTLVLSLWIFLWRNFHWSWWHWKVYFGWLQ